MATLATIAPIALACHKERIALELLSGPGLGKTTWGREFGQQLADYFSEPVLVACRHLTIEAPEEVAGCLGIDWRDGSVYAERSYPTLFPKPYDPVYFPREWDEDQCEAFREAGQLPKRGIIMLDEFRQADTDQIKPAACLIDEGRLDRFFLKDIGHYSVILCSNRAEDKSGVDKPMAFITNRKMETHLGYSVDAHCEWMVMNGIHPKGVAFARANPLEIYSEKVPDHDLPFASPRSFVRSCRFLQALGVMDDQNLGEKNLIAVEGVAGLMGEGAAATFMGFLRRVEDMIPIDEIRKNPNGCRVPDRPDVMWATIQTMTQYATEHSGKEDVSWLLTYMLRFGSEFQIACIRMMVKANRRLFIDKRYSQWVRDNRDLVMAAVAADNASSLMGGV